MKKSKRKIKATIAILKRYFFINFCCVYIVLRIKMLYHSHIISKRKSWRKEDYTNEKVAYKNVSNSYYYTFSASKSYVLTKKTGTNTPSLFLIIHMKKWLRFEAIFIILYLFIDVKLFCYFFRTYVFFHR